MMTILGWSGALLASLGVVFALLMRPASRWAYVAYVLAHAPLACYVLVREDYPMIVLTFVLMIAGVLALWRGFRHRERLTRIESFPRSHRFARRRRACGVVLGSRPNS